MINFGLTIGRIPIVKLFDMGAKQAMAQRNLKKIFIMYTNFKDIIMVLIYLFINRVGSLSWFVAVLFPAWMIKCCNNLLPSDDNWNPHA